MPAVQFRYFLLTIPHHHFLPYKPQDVSYIKGQLEQGESGYLHWQILVHFPKKVTLTKVKQIFGDQVHVEGSRSEAAEAYVWKDDTSLGQRFELGSKSLKRNSPKDWDLIYEQAKSGDFESIPKDILIRSYSSLKKIHVDSLRPQEELREVYVYWGKTGAGKSRLAWEEASFDAYPKDPNSKFWDGYRGQQHIVIDEFRGSISISHLLRWLDRYPVIVEVKGSSVVFKGTRIWITSNISPEEWYPTLDKETFLALRRRFTKVVHFN